jgi:hypothetical protein
MSELIILAILIVSAIGYWIYKDMKKKKAASTALVSETVVVVEQPEVTVDRQTDTAESVVLTPVVVEPPVAEKPIKVKRARKPKSVSTDGEVVTKKAPRKNRKNQD